MNTKLIKLIERIVESRLLKEAFKSDLMRQLNQYVIPEMGYGNRYYNGPVIVKLLTAMGISASEVTDDQMYVGNSGGVTYSKNNPTAAVIIVNNSKQVIAVLYGERHVKLYSSAGTYGGTRDKFRGTNARSSYGRQGRSDKTGLSSIEVWSSSELNNEKFFAIKNATLQVNSGFNKDYAESIKMNIDALSINQKRYAQKIKDMRAEKRVDAEFPDELVQLTTRLLAVGGKMKESLMSAIDNPKSNYPGSNKVTSYGTGSSRRVYNEPYIDMYRSGIKYITDLENAYKSGKDYKLEYAYRVVIDNISTLEKTFK
jgi:hypothetical protein